MWEQKDKIERVWIKVWPLPTHKQNQGGKLESQTASCVHFFYHDSAANGSNVRLYLGGVSH